jgi:ribosomal protein L11 methyltransferase
LSRKPEKRRPRSSASGLWRVIVNAPDAAAAAVASDALSDWGTVSAFEERPDGPWRVEGLSAEPPDRSSTVARLALAWLKLASPVPEPRWERVPATDWVSLNQASFPPLRIGRYFIYGSHRPARVPAGHIGLLIDAATAFGTGEHATTRGCLLALDAVARVGRARRILDMGSGTGGLGLAAAKTWHRRVAAFDIDAEAVRVSAHNARRNGVAHLVQARRSTGYRDRFVARAAPFDLVFANILARPLTLMARDLGRVLAPGGIAVLSGLLPWQEDQVLAAHRAHRLRLCQRLVVSGWSTLIIARGRPLRFRSFRQSQGA